MRLEGKSALITGAASGIGQGIAVAYAREGARVIVVDRNAETGNETVVHITADGGAARFEQADIADAGAVRELMGRVKAQEGVLDILVPNAGIMVCKTLEDTSEEEWDRMPRSTCAACS